MPAYLEFFELERSPFEPGSQSGLVLGTQALRDAFARIEAGLEEDAARLCVNGGSGLGKTSLARALPKLLAGRARVALLLNPALPWAALRASIVKQLDLDDGVLSRQSLLARREASDRLVLVIDAAERIGSEALEHLDILLGYRTDDDRQLVHCVLLANLDHAREQSDCPLLWWLDSLHTLQLEFAPIPVAGVRSYIVKHLKRAGWKGGELFTADAARAVHRLTGGVPRKVSELCEKVLEEAAGRGEARIDVALVEEVAGERPRPDAGATATDASEVLLETVVSSPGPGHADSATSVDAGVPPASAKGADAAPGRSPGRHAGLDAFFGPADESEPGAGTSASTEGPRPEHTASDEDGDTRPDAPWQEPDVESRGRLARLAALAAAVIALLAGGTYVIVRPVSEDADGPAATATAEPTRGTRLPPTERLARQDGAALSEAESADADGPELAPFMRTRPDAAASGATPPVDRPAMQPPTAHAAGAGEPSTEASPAAPAPPAARAPYEDRMDRGAERHF